MRFDNFWEVEKMISVSYSVVRDENFISDVV